MPYLISAKARINVQAAWSRNQISQLQAELKQLKLLHRVIRDYLDKQYNSLKFCFEIGYGFCFPLVLWGFSDRS